MKNIDTGLGARAHGGDPPGRRVGLRDRHLPAAGRAGRGAARAAATGQDFATTRALRRPRRPRPRRRLPDGRRRGALERGPRLRAAPDHAPRRCSRATCSASRARSCRSSTSAWSRRWATPTRSCGASGRRSSAGRAPRRRASAARSSRASACSAELIERAKAGADVVGLRRGRLPPARHLRLPLRDDQGAARRGGPVGRRPGLRGADGAGARGVARAAARTRPRATAADVHVEHERRAALRARRRLPHALRRLRDDRGGHRPARRRARQRLGAGQARGVALLPGGRRPGVRQRASSRRPAGARGWPTCTGSATTRRWRSSRSRASSAPGEPVTGASSSATRGWRRCATTPPPTCCTPRCASGSARTCARPARTSAPTSCASTSPTASACPTRSWPTVERLVSRLDRRQPPGARDRDHPRRGRAARRDGAVRREVRRLGAHGRGRRRSRASCAAARTWPRTGEVGLFHLTTRDLERVERAPHRGGHRARRAPSCSASAPSACASSRRCCACPRTRWCARVERLAERVKELRAGSRAARPTAAPPTQLVARRRRDRRRARGRGGGQRARREGAARAVRRGAPAARRRRGGARHGRRRARAPGGQRRARGGRARREGRRRGARGRARWPAAAAAGATRWRRRAAATPRSCPRRWPPRAPRSSRRSRG